MFSVMSDGSSWVEPVLSKDKCVLHKDTAQWRRLGSNLRPLGTDSSTLPLSHCAPDSCCIERKYYYVHVQSNHTMEKIIERVNAGKHNF